MAIGLTGKKEGKTRLMNMVMQVGCFEVQVEYGRSDRLFSFEKLHVTLIFLTERYVQNFHVTVLWPRLDHLTRNLAHRIPLTNT
jgi:hypothetical protein